MKIDKIIHILKKHRDILSTASAIFTEGSDIVVAEWEFIMPKDISPDGISRRYEIEAELPYDKGNMYASVMWRCGSENGEIHNGVLRFSDRFGYLITIDLKTGKMEVKKNE